MSESNQGPANNINLPRDSAKSGDIGGAEAASLKNKKLAEVEKMETLIHLLWLGASFLAPLTFIFLTSRETEVTTRFYQSIRLGVTSFFIALAIIGLGQIDRKITKMRLDATSQILASLLGLMLWLVWVGSGQMIFKAVDETKNGSEQGRL